MTTENEDLLLQRKQEIQALLNEAKTEDDLEGKKDDEGKGDEEGEKEPEAEEDKKVDEDKEVPGKKDAPGKEDADGDEVPPKGKDVTEGVVISEQEHLLAIFGSDELSEEFKNRVSVVFKTAVDARVKSLLAEETQKLTAEFEATKETLIAEAQEATRLELLDGMDSYLEEEVKRFVEANKPNFDRQVKLELFESLFDGMKTLFESHDIALPEADESLVKQMAERVTLAESELAKTLEHLKGEKILLEDTQRKLFFLETTSELSMLQREKMKSLVEGKTFEDFESYKKEVQMIVESYGKIEPAKVINEEIEAQTEKTEKPQNPNIGLYVEAIGKQVKKS